MLTARTQWGDHQGVAGWEFVDGLHGDKTEIDIMGPWGQQFGMLKKFADIRVSHTGAHEFNVQVSRRGKVLVKMGLRSTTEVTEAELEALTKPVSECLGFGNLPMSTTADMSSVRLSSASQ